MTRTEKLIGDRKMVALDTDQDHIIHEKGKDEYPTIRHMHVREENADNYEELAVADIPKYTKTEYNAEVERLIAERYTTGQEIQFAREQSAAGDKYAEYLAYVDECKARAKEILTAKADSDGSEEP